MPARNRVAESTAQISTWVLQHLFRRDATSMPGRIALTIDPLFIEHAATKLTRGSLIVSGTNGKTTVSNLVVQALEAQGLQVAANRFGANLNSGIASALVSSKKVDYGVFECDELWLPRVLPQLCPTYVLLLDIFRDQLDRSGEISTVQERIVQALTLSPETILIYNADDPLCEAIALRVPNKRIPYGIDEPLDHERSMMLDVPLCPCCSGILSYRYSHYEHLGSFFCTQCEFKRAPLKYFVQDIRLEKTGFSISIFQAGEGGQKRVVLKAPFRGLYMVYNTVAAFIAANILGCDPDIFCGMLDCFKPQKGRLQQVTVAQHAVLINLAKNPAGLNQNIALILDDEKACVVGFFINDAVADGCDVSWLWDADFQVLAKKDDLQIFVGGTRKYEVQLCLKYAGVPSTVLDKTSDMFEYGTSENANFYAIANYTALAPVRRDLEVLAQAGEVVQEKRELRVPICGHKATPRALRQDIRPLRILHLFPDLLNLYGDGGNMTCLERRCEWRGIPLDIVPVSLGDSFEVEGADLIYIGGGPDAEQRKALEELRIFTRELTEYVEAGGALLAICGGYQMLGHTCVLEGEEVEGLGILDLVTTGPGPKDKRLVGNVVLQSVLSDAMIVGYENHAGRTFLGKDVRPFGSVVSSVGYGNNETDQTDGVLYKNVIGTYLHGPLLGKNPALTDWLLRKISCAREVRGEGGFLVGPLDDALELKAAQAMLHRLGIPYF